MRNTMPTRDRLNHLQRQDAGEDAKLEALRKATRVGVADIEAGRFRAFDTAEALTGYLSAEAARAVSEVVESRCRASSR
jgi:antitoxin ParD1/3/4